MTNTDKTVSTTVGTTLNFLASVIKSGEPWTATCQAEFDKAHAALREASRTQEPAEWPVDRDELAQLIHDAGAPPRPPCPPIRSLPETHFVRVAAYRQADAVLALRAAGTEPSWFAVQSVSGAHVGMWEDEGIARRVFNDEYPDGMFIPLYTSPAPLPVGVTDSWQPIETAPKDGTEVLVTGPLYNDSAKGRYRTIAAFKEDGWYENQAAYPEENLLWEPTHWTPLPSLLAIPAKPGEQG